VLNFGFQKNVLNFGSYNKWTSDQRMQRELGCDLPFGWLWLAVAAEFGPAAERLEPQQTE